MCCSSRDSGFSSGKSSRRTPAATPAYKYNDWMDNKKSIKYTPRLVAKDRENDKGFMSMYCLDVASDMIYDIFSKSKILDIFTEVTICCYHHMHIIAVSIDY